MPFSAGGLRVSSHNNHVLILNDYSSIGYYGYIVDNSLKISDFKSVFNNLCVAYDENFENLLSNINITNFIPFLNSYYWSNVFKVFIYCHNNEVLDRDCYFRCYDGAGAYWDNAYWHNAQGEAFKVDGNEDVIGFFDRSISFNTVLINDGETQYFDLGTFCSKVGSTLDVLDGVYFVLIHYFDIPVSSFDNCLGSDCGSGCEFFDLSIRNHSQQIIGAFRVSNGVVYCCQADHVFDDDFENYSISLNDYEFCDFYDYYFNGIISESFSHEVNCFGKSICIEVRYVEDMASDESVLALKESLDCICTAVGSVASKIQSFSQQNTVDFSSLVNELDFININFVTAFNDELMSDSHLGQGSVFKKFISNNSILSFADLFSNTFLRGNNLDKSVFRTLLDIDFADSFSSAFNLLSGAGSVFTNNAINPANYRSIYDDFHDSFYNSDCDSWFIESFNEAFNLTNCEGSVFKANDDIWNDEDTLAGIWYKVLDYDYLMDLNSRVSPFYVNYTSSGRLFNVGLSSVLGRGLFNGAPSGSSANVFNTSANQKFSDVLKVALFTNTDSYHAIHQNSVFQIGAADNIKLLNHSCDVNPNSIKFCESLSQPAIPVQISAPIEISQSEDEWGEPLPFKMDWKPLLDLLSEALFCQFGNDGLDPRASWGYSVFNKLLYPLHPEGCDDKVGLPELDFSDGFVPDNIFVNSNGLIARYNSEIYK